MLFDGSCRDTRSVLDSEYLIESWGAREGCIDNVQFLLSILELCASCIWVALDEGRFSCEEKSPAVDERGCGFHICSAPNVEVTQTV
jgi:hypothetical protein